jgi:uncharacterized RDD family membrane protein YckC
MKIRRSIFEMRTMRVFRAGSWLTSSMRRLPESLCGVWFVALREIVPKDVLLLGWVAILFAYFVIFKRSRFGTVGYRVFKVRIVGLDGQPPSLGSLTLRWSFMALGPLNYLLDLLWLSSDPHRQAVRDKFAHTYVVKQGAEPAGTAKVIYRYYDILGYNFLFREIEVERTKSAKA